MLHPHDVHGDNEQVNLSNDRRAIGQRKWRGRRRWRATRAVTVTTLLSFCSLLVFSLPHDSIATSKQRKTQQTVNGGQQQEETTTTTTAQFFNFEVEKRILERLDFYLGDPVAVNQLIDNFRTNGGFINQLKAPDRDLYLSLAYSVSQPLVYYGLEDGTIPGYYWANGYYREPGNSGYDVDNEDMTKHLNSCIDSFTGEATQCILEDGADYISCTPNSNDNNNNDHDPETKRGNDSGFCPKLEICPNQPDCVATSKTIAERQICQKNLKWCRQYTIEKYNSQDDDDGRRRGYIPLTNFCINRRGQFTQDVGEIIDPLGTSRTDDTLVDCIYGDGSLVQRDLTGPYAACGRNGNGVEVTSDGTTSMITATNNTENKYKNCSSVFVGGYQSAEYDPRYRPWYITTKKLQRASWLPPYTFFSLALGVTFSQPIYTYDEELEKQIFAGVLAVDYRFEDITQFLIDSYGTTTTAVVIFENDEPNYLIGSSTGAKSARFFLSDNLTIPCPFDHGDDIPCTPLRTAMKDLAATTTTATVTTVNHQNEEEENDKKTLQGPDFMNIVLTRAFERHSEEGYPQELLSVVIPFEESSPTDDSSSSFGWSSERNTDSRVFVSQSTLYEQLEAKLSWRIIIVSPALKSDNDAITQGDPLLAVICIIGGLGFVACFAFSLFLYAQRFEKAVIYADWRFTCAFIFGCTLLNGSTFALIGENTDTTCLLRMWTFHLLFVVALSPLFVKVWRIKQLVGMERIQRNTITNVRATLYTLPLIIAQIILLLVFTFIDPSKKTEIIENDNSDGMIIQRVVCDHETNAFLISISIFEAGVVLIGCILAYMTRNMDDDFGEAKQLIFAMYNIAFVGCIIILVYNIADVDGHGLAVLQAVGVFWGTVFSTAAFVVPRLIQVRRTRIRRLDLTNQFNIPSSSDQQNRHGSSSVGSSTILVSGILPLPTSSFLERIEEDDDINDDDDDDDDDIEFDDQNNNNNDTTTGTNRNDDDRGTGADEEESIPSVRNVTTNSNHRSNRSEPSKEDEDEDVAFEAENGHSNEKETFGRHLSSSSSSSRRIDMAGIFQSGDC